MTHFVPCHKEIKVKESADLFIDIFYKLHGVHKVIVSDKESPICWKILAIIYDESEYQTQYEYG